MHSFVGKYVVQSISYQTFCTGIYNCRRLENSVCYCYTSYEMTDQFFMISGSNEQLQQQLEYTLLKPDCRWVNNCLDAHLSQIICDKDGIMDWCIVQVEMPLT